MSGHSRQGGSVEAQTRRLRADSLADSVVILMALTLVQPFVGFIRGVLFCRWLDPDQLGRWDLALGFLTLTAPLVVLGIPGSFGKYVEHYRQRGQLRNFLRSATLVTIGLTLLAIVVLWAGASWFSLVLFGTSGETRFIWVLAMALPPLVAFGFVTELLNAFRLYRVVSGLQLLRSASFLILGMLFLAAIRLSAVSVLAAYALASLATVAASSYSLWRAWGDVGRAANTATTRQIWLRFMPFAMWVWVCNNLTNLFEVADRYMLVHFSGLPAERALELVGNYHSSRVVPLLIVVFANMLASVLLPHLSHAWESAGAREVDGQLRLAVKLFGFALSAGSAVFLWLAPLLFRVAFDGKYNAGLAVLPWTLVYCIWFGIAFVGQMYLWCRDEARLGSLALFLGLIVGLGVNTVLLPRFGLLGAVLACSAARFTLMIAVFAFSRSLGLRGDVGTWVACALPLGLLAGPKCAIALCAVIGVGSLASPYLLNNDEKTRLQAVLARYAGRLRALPGGDALARWTSHPSAAEA